MYPVVRVEGDARERGRQYGAQAQERVRRSIDAYREVFAHFATWDWSTVVVEARRFHEPIKAFGPQYFDEITGIAEGAEVDLDDVVAINVRTEIMFAAKARASAATLPRVSECSAFAHVADDGQVIVGQNWDWLPHAFDTTVVLEAAPDAGPRFVTVVEAGLLAKFGMNSAGLGLVTNAMVSALDVEAVPGDFTRLFLLQPDERGTLVHTNHFLSPQLPSADVGVWVMPDSPFRWQRVRAAMRSADGPEAYERMLTDHAGHPYGVCCHPDLTLPPPEQGATVVSGVMDLRARTLRLAAGFPCTAGFETRSYADFFGEAAGTPGVA